MRAAPSSKSPIIPSTRGRAAQLLHSGPPRWSRWRSRSEQPTEAGADQHRVRRKAVLPVDEVLVGAVDEQVQLADAHGGADDSAQADARGERGGARAEVWPQARDLQR